MGSENHTENRGHIPGLPCLEGHGHQYSTSSMLGGSRQIATCRVFSLPPIRFQRPYAGQQKFSRKLQNWSEKWTPFWGPKNGPQNGGHFEVFISIPIVTTQWTPFWGPFFGPQNGVHVLDQFCIFREIANVHCDVQRASESRAAAKKKRKYSKPTTSLEYAACAILAPTPLRTGEGLQCDPGFRGNFRHPFWGPRFRPHFTARGSHTINLGSSFRSSVTVRGSHTTNIGSSSGPQLQCAGPTP